MTVGIAGLGTYLPPGRIDQVARAEQFDLKPEFIQKKTGVLTTAIKESGQTVADMCSLAFANLLESTPVDLDKVGVAVLVTQNPDHSVPHTSAVLQHRLGLSTSSACFDLSLGCSGYVYGLSVVESWMKQHNISSGLLFTCDPYSRIVDPKDKNTSLLFGDGATVTLLGENAIFETGRCVFGTMGDEHEALEVEGGRLYMKGRNLLNFAARVIPREVDRVLALNNLSKNEIDQFLMHPGSKFLIDTLRRRLNLSPEKIPFGIEHYGNTVSSSLPFLLSERLGRKERQLLLCGFGAGLSWSSTILRRTSQ